MADTFEEAIRSLSAEDAETRPVCIIDNDLRTITTPSNFILGVYNDKDVHEILFSMPRYYNDIDLSVYSIRVNYINAAGTENDYYAETKDVLDDTIKFSWLTSRMVFSYAGEVRFIVCLRNTDEEGVITNEFNTTIASGIVLEGIEVDDHQEDPEISDLIVKITKAKDAAEEAAKQSEENVEHYPRIEDGKWIVYDAKNDAWVDTGIAAQGPKGDTGETGAKGDTGKTPDLHIGAVYNVPYGQSATASITGTPERPILSLAIPEGARGAKGDTGATGPKGDTGAIGTPLVASTASDMTDTTRLYIYTGSESGYSNGHWYHYDGTAWVDGGLYNAVAFQTDKSLSVEGMAADSAATGEAIDDLKADLQDFTLAKVGKNINNCGYEGGYIASNGTDTTATYYESAAFRSNGYIPVIGGETIYWWGKLSNGTALGANAVIVEYDSQKNLIGQRHPFNKYGTTADNQAFTTSSNAAYVRIALYQGVEDKSTIQIALYYAGNEQTSYVPYSKKKVVDYSEIYDSNMRSADAIIDDKFSALGFTPLYDYEEITVAGESGALRPNGTVTETTDVTRYKIPVSKGERYVVSARHGYAYKAFLILDSEDNILSYYPETNAGTEIHRNVQVDIEQDGYLVLQDVYHFMPILGKLTKYSMNDNLYQKSIYWNGDSICFGAGGTSFADQISLFHAMPETMDAVSGTRLSTRSGATNSIYERVISMDTTAEYDFIGIEGGYNDYFSSVPIGALMSNYSDTPDTSTVIGAVEGICKHIRTNFPNSKFFFVLGHRPIAVGAYHTDVDTYWDAILTALNKWAVPYVDIRKEGTLMAYNNDWLADYFGEGETMGTHPNTEGYTKFYNPLVEDRMKSL